MIITLTVQSPQALEKRVSQALLNIINLPLNGGLTDCVSINADSSATDADC